MDLERLDPEGHGSDLWASIGADAKAWAEIPPGPFAGEAEFVAWLRSRAERPDAALFAVIDKTGERPTAAGLYFLLRIDPAMGTAETGLVYGPALVRRTGGTEAFLLLAGYVFGSGYRRLEWRCSPANTRSQRAASRFGFAFEGLLRQTMWLKGRNWDTMLYAMLDRDWPGVEARLTAWLAPENFRQDGGQIKVLKSV